MTRIVIPQVLLCFFPTFPALTASISAPPKPLPVSVFLVLIHCPVHAAQTRHHLQRPVFHPCPPPPRALLFPLPPPERCLAGRPIVRALHAHVPLLAPAPEYAGSSEYDPAPNLSLATPSDVVRRSSPFKTQRRIAVGFAMRAFGIFFVSPNDGSSLWAFWPPRSLVHI